MTNDLTTVGGVLQQTIDDLETNLQAMGVSDAEFDPVTGILGLIARIPEIEPAPVGVDLNMNLTLTTPEVANKNVPVTLTATLQGTYDDTTEDNVDVNAEMQGATIEFYNGETLLGTSITNNEGVATFEYTPTEAGTLVISAVFNGTELWDNAISNTKNVNVSSLTISSSAEIVSEGDEITLTAKYLDYENNPVENAEINFINTADDSIIGTATTDSNGECSVSYSVEHTLPLNIKAKLVKIVSTSLLLTNILWQPALNGETGARYNHSYSESNGDVLGLVSWEGSWPEGSAYASYTSGSVGWFDVTVTKIDDTNVRLQSETLNRDTTVNVSWLPNYDALSCGVHHHRDSSSFGPCRIRNIKAVKI